MTEPSENARMWLRTVGTDCVEAAAEGTLEPTWARDAEIDAVVDALDEGHSVLLVGADGVGRRSILRGVAQRLAAREGRPLGLLRTSTTEILSGTKYLGEWQTRLHGLVESAVEGRTAVWFADLERLETAGSTSNDPTAMLDALKPHLDGQGVQVIGVLTPAQVQAMRRHGSFVESFRQIAVEPLSARRSTPWSPPPPSTWDWSCPRRHARRSST